MNKSVCAWALMLGLLLSGPSGAVRITPAHSGTWYDPAYDKQGFVIEVLQKAGRGPERIATVQWYTYDDAGNPVWAVGSANTDGHRLTVLLQQAFGGVRPPAQLPASDLVDFALVYFEFGTCHRATADFEMSAGASVGHYDLQRLTQIGATSCSGGISDEVEPGAEPLTLVTQLQADASVPGAQGSVMFKLRPALASLEIDLRKLPVAVYQVRVGGSLRGSVTMTVNGNGNGISRGDFGLFSPEAGNGLLDFDPRGMLIEIVAPGGSVVLSGTLEG